MAGTFEYIGTSNDDRVNPPIDQSGIDVYARSDVVHSTGNLMAMIYQCKGAEPKWRGKVMLTYHLA